MLSIEYSNIPPKNTCYITGYKPIQANIIIGDLKEHVDIQIGHWSLYDYKIQWIDGANRLINGMGDTSLLVTQALDPNKKEKGYAIEAWVLYKEIDTVYAQNVYFTHQIVPIPWDINKILDTIPLREQPKETNKSSEWKINVNDLIGFRDEVNSSLEVADKLL